MAGEWDADAASAAHVRVRHPAAAALLLRQAAAPGASAGERAAVLELLLLLCSSASLSQQAQQGNQDQLLAAPTCWQQHLLDCLVVQADGSRAGAPARPGSAGAGDATALAAAAAAWRLLALLLARGIAASPHGWHLLQAVVSLLKAQPGRAYLVPDYASSHSRSSSSGGGGSGAGGPTVVLAPAGGWHLLQSLLADVVLELLAAQAADAATAASGGAASPTAGGARLGVRRTSSEWDAWTMVSQVRGGLPYCDVDSSCPEHFRPLPSSRWWPPLAALPASRPGCSGRRSLTAATRLPCCRCLTTSWPGECWRRQVKCSAGRMVRCASALQPQGRVCEGGD